MRKIWFRPPSFRQFLFDAGEVHAADTGGRDAVGAERDTCRTNPDKPVTVPKREAERQPSENRHTDSARLRGARQKAEQIISRYGYYIAAGVCALVVFAGIVTGLAGRTTGPQSAAMPSERPAHATLAPETEISAAAYAAPESARLACWPLEGEIITEYAADKLIYLETLGLYGTHMGLDIAGDRGAPVVACADGEIVRFWREALMGNVVELRTDDGLILQYANLGAPDGLQEGIRVKAGEVIGHVGQSAMSESMLKPHLHFEIIENGANLPPYGLLPQK